MRILILATMYPDTLACGYRHKLYRLLQGYHRHGHHVDLMAFIPPGSKPTLHRGLVEPWCDRIFLFENTVVPARRSVRRWLGALRSLDSNSLGCSSRALAAELGGMLRDSPPDLVQLDGYPMLQYGKYVSRVPCVAFPHDCYTLSLESEKDKSPRNAVRLALQRLKVRNMERRYNTFSVCFFVARPDAERARELSPGTNAAWAPNGVDADYFAPAGELAEPDTIAFHGNMAFPPNVEAATWFMREVWPTIKARHSKSRFLVVGANPDQRVLDVARGDSRIVVTGSVSDIRPHLQRAQVLVVPMRSGGGIKNKVLEGMALSKPVVATGLAMAGIERAIVGEHFMLADTPTQFIEVIGGLWQSAERTLQIGTKARSLVQAHYSWESVQDFVQNLLLQAARQPGLSGKL